MFFIYKHITFISIPRLKFRKTKHNFGLKSEKFMKELPNRLVTLFKRKLWSREAHISG